MLGILRRNFKEMDVDIFVRIHLEYIVYLVRLHKDFIFSSLLK